MNLMGFLQHRCEYNELRAIQREGTQLLRAVMVYEPKDSIMACVLAEDIGQHDEYSRTAVEYAWNIITDFMFKDG